VYALLRQLHKKLCLNSLPGGALAGALCHVGLSAVFGRRDNAQDLEKMVASLRDGSYTALILDSPVLEYITGQNEACDLFLVGDTFETFSVALAFPPATNSSLVYDFSLSIVKLQVCPHSRPTSAPSRCICCSR
jgi:hypothetical protein